MFSKSSSVGQDINLSEIHRGVNENTKNSCISSMLRNERRKIITEKVIGTIDMTCYKGK